MTVKEVYSVLDGKLKDQTREEALIRLQCFWGVKPYWGEKNGKLKHPKQLWSIPSIDIEEEKEVKLSKITVLKKGEKPFQNLIKKG
ncbi:MAG: hypothetical protein NXI20_17845 [bacterium]|nr:hypothetical protein [bacterium]